MMMDAKESEMKEKTDEMKEKTDEMNKEYQSDVDLLLKEREQVLEQAEGRLKSSEKCILCLIMRTTVTSLSTPNDTRCKTHPLCVNLGVPF